MKEDLTAKRNMAQLIALKCLELNSIGDRMQGKGPAVWFELAPHVGAITVRVIERGWIEGVIDDENKPDFNIMLWSFSDIEDYEICLEYLKSLEVKRC